MDKNQLASQGREEAIKILSKIGVQLNHELIKSRGPIFFSNNKGNKSTIYIRVKQSKVWPHCKGLTEQNSFLVLVDFAASTNDSSFYILDKIDWFRVIIKRIDEIHKTRPNKRIQINDNNTPVFIDEVGKDGKAFEGIDISVDDVINYRNCWKKIESEA